MKVYDISMNIHPEMQVYRNKDENRPIIKILHDYENSHFYVSRINMDMHTGTHIDAPLHIIKNGNTIEGLDLSKVITKCKVLDLTSVSESITKSILIDKSIEKGDFILLKTRNSSKNEFDSEFVYLEKSGAEFLREKEITGVGIDALSIERAQKDCETHKILLGAEIIVIEGLRLGEVVEGGYTMCALPLKIDGAEASPARVILMDLKQ